MDVVAASASAATANNSTGIHFTDAWVMQPISLPAANIHLYDLAGSDQASNVVAFFTGLAGYGVIDSTNWTANTFKTIFTHTGRGLVSAMFACTAGGAETSVFEITIDGGTAQTITVTNASGERAALSASGLLRPADFTTSASAVTGFITGLAADGATFNGASDLYVPPLRLLPALGTPLLRYNTACLIRMKHSVNITNSTATAYSGVMVRKGIAA